MSVILKRELKNSKKRLDKALNERIMIQDTYKKANNTFNKIVAIVLIIIFSVSLCLVGVAIGNSNSEDVNIEFKIHKTIVPKFEITEENTEHINKNNISSEAIDYLNKILTKDVYNDTILS